jgi:hypothetical protein
LATSFYNEKDEDIAPYLVKNFMECNQPVPDFLESFKPVDGNLAFDDDTDGEGENGDQTERVGEDIPSTDDQATLDFQPAAVEEEQAASVNYEVPAEEKSEPMSVPTNPTGFLSVPTVVIEAPTEDPPAEKKSSMAW